MKAKRIPHTMGLLVQNQGVLGELTDTEADTINRQPHLFLQGAIQAWRNQQGGAEPPKFRPLADLGVLEWKEEYYLGDALKPSRMPKHGDKFRVQLHEQIVDKTTSEERLTYLKSLPNTVLLGVHGHSMIYDQKRNDLPKGKWTGSFDRVDRIPFLNIRRKALKMFDTGGESFLPPSNGFAEFDWCRHDLLVSFSDEPQPSES